MEEDSKSHILKYKIHKWSSFSSSYRPEKILENLPSEQSSRWSSETNYLPQFILLKLHEPAIVKTITFGKYDKDHVCNLKKFKVYGGLEENNMIELLSDGLKNDNVAETFSLKCKMEGDNYFPCNYIKIAPILSWGPSYNFSIWYVELHGYQSTSLVERSTQWYYKYREREAIRLCLKHFREHNYMDAFRNLQEVTNVKLESSLVSRLHDNLVEQGNFQGSEDILEKVAQDDSMFSDYLNNQDYHANWTCVNGDDDDDDVIKPGMRGGHQMCIDYKEDQIYIFGGWSGNKDLADFWRFDCNTSQWTCLSRDTTVDGGPTPRSCHKMCIDCDRKLIYTLGRYLDSSKRNVASLDNQLHRYSIKDNRWTLMCEDVARYGTGPKLIFDHQMCMDEEHNMIYVFGGRVLTPSPSPGVVAASNAASGVLGGGNDERSTTEFSGLYSFHVPTNEWKLLRPDSGNAGPQDIRSRIGHSMLLDTATRRLYIFGGQRLKEDVNDFLYYDIDNDKVVVLNDGSSKDSSFPPPGFTQRATIDSKLGEIYMLSGLSKERNKRDENMQNSFWVYNIKSNKWRCVYKNDPNNSSSSSTKSLRLRKAKTHHHLPKSVVSMATGSNLASSNSGLNIKYSKTPFSSDTSKSSRETIMNYYQQLQPQQPCPRYAHQLVYNPLKRIHYMFGGNPGKYLQPQLRLDDFWKLRLSRKQASDVLKRCKYLIRRQHFNEMASRGNNPCAARDYLTTKVYEMVDHECERDDRRYRHLARKLFGDTSHLRAPSESSDSDEASEDFVSRALAVTSFTSSRKATTTSAAHKSMAVGDGVTAEVTSDSDGDVDLQTRANRTAVFNKIMLYFNEQLKQPNQNITDIVPIS